MKKIKRAVVMAVGSGGDVAPLAAIAEKIADYGLDTTLLAPQRYRHMVEGTSVSFRSIGADDVFAEVFDGPDIWTPAKGLAASWQYYGAAMRTGLSILRNGWHPADTILVSSTFAVAARLAEELDGYSNTTIHLSPSVIFSGYRPPKWPASSIPPHWPTWMKRLLVAAAERFATDPVIGAHVNPFRAELGLPPVRRLFSDWIHSRQRVIYAFPEWYAAAAEDWPAQGRFAGFPRYIPREHDLPPSLEAFLQNGSGPVVVITAGTAVASQPPWVKGITRYAVGHGARVIVVGPTSPSEVAESNVYRVPFVPFHVLLPRVQLIIHHAGIGTMAEALRAGLPQWLVPTAHDQPDNAHRLQELGLGRVLNPAFRMHDVDLAWHWALHDAEARQALTTAKNRIEKDMDGATSAAMMLHNASWHVDAHACGLSL